MTQLDSNDTGTSQAEGEGPDGSDKPPRPPAINTSRPPNGSHMNLRSPISPTTNGTKKQSLGRSNVPLPAREASSHPKEPQIVAGVLAKDVQGHLHNSSPSTTSLSSSDHESWSPPSSRAPSRRSSRAASFTAVRLSGLLSPKKQTPATPQPAGVEQPSTPRSKAPSSVHSDSAHKFTLKELLASAPKLGRKSSVRSTGSSKKSESDGGARSVAESTSTLLRKYGVCDNGSIGKGATSVVRLVHKWDRTEEKIYAVKVGSSCNLLEGRTVP
jgi:protein-serine/threonine kinase